MEGNTITPNTVAIDDIFMFISSDKKWGIEDFENLGHELLDIHIKGVNYDHRLNRDYDHLIDYRDKSLIIHVKERVVPTTDTIFFIGEEFNQNRDILLANMQNNEKLDGFKFKVLLIRTRNLETNDILTLKSKKTQVTFDDDIFVWKVNDTSYRDIDYMKVIEAAGELACKECLYETGKTTPARNGCSITGRFQ